MTIIRSKFRLPHEHDGKPWFELIVLAGFVGTQLFGRRRMTRLCLKLDRKETLRVMDDYDDAIRTEIMKQPQHHADGSVSVSE
jgi:hypothetical protein